MPRRRRGPGWAARRGRRGRAGTPTCCPRLGPLKQAHAHLVVAGHGRSLPLTTKLATLAVEGGAASYAHVLAASHPTPDSFLFSTLTRAAAHRGLPATALTFYRSLLTAGVPFSSFTFTAVVKSCADLSALRAGMAFALTLPSLGLAPIDLCRQRLL